MRKFQAGVLLTALSLLALSGCAEMKTIQEKVAGTPSDNPTFSILYDQGDYMKDLVAKKDYERAAKLYSDENAYFETHADKMKDLVAAAADGLNAAWSPRLVQDLNICSLIQWPAPQAQWPLTRTRLTGCASDIENYEAIKLVAGDRALKNAGALDQVVTGLQTKISADATSLLMQEDVYSGRNFFTAYPVQVSLDPELVRRLRSQFNAKSSAQNLLVTARAYKGQSPAITQELSDEFSELIAHSKSKGSLREIVDLYNTGVSAGIASSSIPVTVAIYVANDGRAPFTVNVDRDVPLQWKDVGQAEVASGAFDADYLVVVGAARPRVDRKIGRYSKERSKYLAGYQNVPNPSYTSAMLDLQRAQQSMANARAAQIQASSDLICNAYGCHPNPYSQLAANIVMIAAERQFNQAQGEVRSTPPMVSEPVYQDYAYDTSVIASTKQTGWELVIQPRGAKTMSVRSSQYRDSKDFTVAYNVNDKDDNGVRSRYSSETDVDQWEKGAVSLRFSDMLTTSEPRELAAEALERFAWVAEESPHWEKPTRSGWPLKKKASR